MGALIEIRHTVSAELFRSMKPADLKRLLGEDAYTEGVKRLAARVVAAESPPRKTMWTEDAPSR